MIDGLATVEGNENPSGHATLLSRDPIIIASPAGSGLDFVAALARKSGCRPITFLLHIGWHCDEAAASKKAVAAQRFSSLFPMHKLIFLGNTQQEATHLIAAGLDAFCVNCNIFVPEEIFRPLDVPIAFDAVYNARPFRWKRHELAFSIDRVAYLCGVTPAHPLPDAREIAAEIQRLGGGHVLVNQVVEGLPQWISAFAVNEALAQAAVGLCLSEVEGQMRASIEYLAAGLPVVSTPSLGGRDVFFDPDYCIIADPTPLAIRDAVQAVRSRNIPRDYVRTRTLAKLQPERHRFLALVEELRARSGAPRIFGTLWPHSGVRFHKWRSAEDHAREFFDT